MCGATPTTLECYRALFRHKAGNQTEHADNGNHDTANLGGHATGRIAYADAKGVDHRYP